MTSNFHLYSGEFKYNLIIGLINIPKSVFAWCFEIYLPDIFVSLAYANRYMNHHSFPLARAGRAFRSLKSTAVHFETGLENFHN